MRKKASFAALLLTLFLLCACANGGREVSGPYQLYFILGWGSNYGSALATEDWEGESETPTAQELMQALLDGPARDGLISPFPRGVSVQSLELEGETGVLRLTLSEQYSGLTDMAQTLADASIVMTLCQLPGVEAVEISTDGFWASRPASRTLAPEQLDLESLLPQ